MKDATLVIMEAGIGSRYGGGIKQLEKIGPNGEIIMDYSVHDAVEAGFNKVIFVIRKDLEKDFYDCIGYRVEQKVKTDYVFQEVTDIPGQYKERFKDRTKPWGTGQAILACKGLIHEPFLIINADDYYGKQAYKEAYEYLVEDHTDTDLMNLGMVGFVLENTLSENGAVTRGVCKVDEADYLLTIQETYGVHRVGEFAVSEDGQEIPLKSPVSMNMWAVPAEFIDILDVKFHTFLEELPEGEMKAEFLLPKVVENLLVDKKASVKVLRSSDRWFGVTYKEDKEYVVESIRELIKEGYYPEALYR